MYALRFTQEAKSALAIFKKSNPRLFKKFAKILIELEEHPRTGLGHPEALKGGNGTTYSRRITAQHRLIYNIYDDKILVLIISVEGHYDDK